MCKKFAYALVKEVCTVLVWSNRSFYPFLILYNGKEGELYRYNREITLLANSFKKWCSLNSYLITCSASYTKDFPIMSAAVDIFFVVEVDQIDQNFLASLTNEAFRVPALFWS